MPSTVRSLLPALLALSTSLAVPAALYACAPAAEEALMMPDAQFWAIIAASRPAMLDSEGQPGRLRAALRGLPANQLAAFQNAFDRKINGAYDWNLWGAGFVIHGGMSDDGFHYFRCWLVAQGQEVYAAALADPDSLAAILPAGIEASLEFEDICSIGAEAWSEATGKDELPPGGEPAPQAPSGKAWKETEADLSQRFPRLWRRYGATPLG